MTTVLKLGGSLITEKTERETVDEAGLARAASAIGDADVTDLVLIHGGGSFGHFTAEDHGVSSSDGTTDATAIRDIHAAMGRLNRAVLTALGEAGVPAVPVRPFSAGYRPDAGSVWHASEQIEAMLAEGFVPVLHGDVFTTAGAGATIVSGDELVVSMAESLDADSVGLCASVEGVLDEEGEVISEIDDFETVADVLGGSEATDVTGGMAAKVSALLELDAPSRIFDLDGLPAFLAGGEPGTLVDGRSR